MSYTRLLSVLIASAVGCGGTTTSGSTSSSSSSASRCNGQLCAWQVVEPCAPANAPDAGPDAGDPCFAMCNLAHPLGASPVFSCTTTHPDGGASTLVLCSMGCTGGRPPRGFAPRKSRAKSLAGARLAEMSQLEAASVHAFRALYTDLARLGAPRSILRAVREAGEDEVRHARQTRRAAVRYGARVPRTRVAPSTPRSLVALAIENAEEGCVKETFSAALAHVQAERAADPRVRRMMRRIAADELGHAALSWRLADWLDARLDPAARAAVKRARAATVAQLHAALNERGVPELGLPDAAIARAILARMAHSLADGVSR